MYAHLTEAAPSSSKKYTVIVYDPASGRRKTISFGARGYADFTMHRDEARKRRYESRHRARERWDDPFTAGFWAEHLLWNKPTIQASVDDIHRKFGILFY